MKQITFALLVLFYGSMANAGVLEDIYYSQSENSELIHIEFSMPVVYLSHRLTSRSKKLTVNFRFQNAHRVDFNALPLEETLLAPASALSSLVETTFINQDDFTRLELVFNSQVSVTVSQTKPNILSVSPRNLAKKVKVVKNKIPKISYIDKVFGKGLSALKDGENSTAIEIFSMLISGEKHGRTQESMELLGVARERKKQKSQARLVYQQYLKKYPDSDGAVRVRQRMANMLQSDLTPKKRLKASMSGKSSDTVFGTVSQYFYYGRNNLAEVPSNVDQQLLVSQVSTHWRHRTPTHEMRSFFYASNSHDFTTDTNDGIEVSSLYWKYKHYRQGLIATVGRQSAKSGGVLGRFDGLSLGYNVTGRLRSTFVYGYPVDYSDKQNIQSHRPFVGLSADLSGYWKAWDINPYIITQKNNGLNDRQAVGTEVRYVDKKRTVYSMVDYDVSYNDLNIFILRGQHSLENKTSLITSFEFRNNPLLETGNALIGQAGVTDLNGLQATMTDEEIRELADSRTGDSATLSIGATRAITNTMQINGNFTYATQHYVTDTGTGGIEEVEEDQQYYSGQLVIGNLFSERDTTIFSLRQAITSSYDELSLTMSNRFRVDKKLGLDARVRFSYRDEDEGGSLDKIKPTVKVNYRYNKQMQLLWDLGMEWWKYGGNNREDDYKRTSTNIGYRWLF